MGNLADQRERANSLLGHRGSARIETAGAPRPNKIGGHLWMGVRRALSRNFSPFIEEDALAAAFAILTDPAIDGFANTKTCGSVSFCGARDTTYMDNSGRAQPNGRRLLPNTSRHRLCLPHSPPDHQDAESSGRTADTATFCYIQVLRRHACLRRGAQANSGLTAQRRARDANRRCGRLSVRAT